MPQVTPLLKLMSADVMNKDYHLKHHNSEASSRDMLYNDNSSIHILLSMKHAVPSPPNNCSASNKQDEASVVPSSPTSGCNLNSCLVCERGVPAIVIRSPTWSTIMRVVFYTLKHSQPEKQYFNLRTDVYNFMVFHWDTLCLSKDPTHNWKKQIQDMLSHSKNLFESGSEQYKQNGFWRLKPAVDPWTITKPQRERSKSKDKRDENLKRASEDLENSGDDVVVPQVKRSKMSPIINTTFDEVDTSVPKEENKELFSEFQNLKTEIEMMREKMKMMTQELRLREKRQEEEAMYSRISDELAAMQESMKCEVESMRKQITLLNNNTNTNNSSNNKHQQFDALVVAPQQLDNSSNAQQQQPNIADNWPKSLMTILATSVLNPLQLVPQSESTPCS